MFEKEIRKENRKWIVDAMEDFTRYMLPGRKDDEIGSIVHWFHLLLFVFAVVFFLFFPNTRLFLLALFIVVILCNFYFHGCIVNSLELRFGRTFLMTDTVLEAFGLPVNNKVRYDTSVFFLIIALTVALWAYIFMRDDIYPLCLLPTFFRNNKVTPSLILKNIF